MCLLYQLTQGLKQHNHILNQHAYEDTLPAKRGQIKNVSIKKSAWNLHLREKMEMFWENLFHPLRGFISQIFGIL